MSKPKLKILYGEGDSDVLAQQAAAMEKVGYAVHQAISRKGVEEGLRSGPFDLVILGGTLTRNERHHLVYMVKKASAESKVLVLHADGTRHPYVDACTDTGADTEHVLARIEAMNLLTTAPKAAAAAVGKK
jgi:DNA-binding NtrC family response regulator